LFPPLRIIPKYRHIPRSINAELHLSITSPPDDYQDIVASPSYLQFGSDKEKLNFNVDRKSLKAGYKIKRDYTCRIEAVDTSGNAI
jgi:hypothetical protein